MLLYRSIWAWLYSRRAGHCPTRLSLVQVNVVQPRRVLAHDLPLHLIANALEVPRYGLARTGPGGHQMRVIAGPHVVVYTKEICVAHADLIVNECGVHLAAEVLARQQL